MIFCAAMKALLACLLALPTLAALAAEPVRVLAADQWDRPRSGDFVRGVPVLVETVRAFDLRPGRRLTVRYPGGEAGLLWAEELKGWLVALGLESERIAVVPGARHGDALELIVETDTD